MKLIVGLGNPGKDYANTRHNVGFFMLDKYLEYKNIQGFKSKFDGEYIDTFINNQKVIFLKPQSFINLSGEVVRKFVDFYKIDLQDILIISDDLDLNLGNFKLKSKGSSGGHNGLKNIEKNLNTSEYKRIKVGISNDKKIDAIDYVLGKLTSDEVKVLNEVSSVINNILDDYFDYDFNSLVSKYNRKNR